MSKRHEAEQLPLKGVPEPSIKVAPTLFLRGDVLTLWRRYQDAQRDLQPSDGQLITSLVAKGLRAWEAERVSKS